MIENEKGSITETGKQGSVPPKKGWLDLAIKVSPLLVFTCAFIGLIFTIHTFIHNREEEHDSANLTKRDFFSSLGDREKVEDAGGTVEYGDDTVINDLFADGGCGAGFISRREKEVITFPIDGFTNMKAGTVGMCVTLKQKLKDDADYPLLAFHKNKANKVYLEIAWNDNDGDEGKKYDGQPYHNVRLRLKPNSSGKGRIHSPKVDWQPGEHHHIAATWGAKGLYIYIDGEIDGEPFEGEAERVGENFDQPFAINNDHPDKDLAKEPTHCVVRNLLVANYQKTHEEVKKHYKKLHGIEE